MKLAAFFEAVAPLLEGTATSDETARALYGEVDSRDSRDARRLSIYGRFCRVHRFEAVDSVYAHCRAAVLRLAGEPVWSALVERYFARHPMRHFELNQNGEGLPTFLVEEAASHELPGWLAELADLEWWEWQTAIAPDDSTPPDAARPRLSSTVELRPYQHDLLAWLDGNKPADRPLAPLRGDVLVVFWRDRDLAARRGSVEPDELAVIKAVYDGNDLSGISERLRETVDDLREAGILVG